MADKFNAEKSHIIKLGKSAKNPDWDYKLRRNRLQESDNEKNL